MSKLLKTFLMLLVIGGLAALLYFSKDDSIQRQHVFSELNSADELEAFFFQTNDEQLVFSRNEDFFKLVKPFQYPLDRQVVEGMLNGILALDSLDTVPPGDREEDLAEYGFSEPTAVVGISLAEGSFKAVIGKEHPLGGKRYVARADLDQIYLVDEKIFAAINKSFFDVRDKSPLKIAFDEVKSFSVNRRIGGKLNFAKGEEWWVSTDSKRIKADTELIEKNLRELLDLKVLRFIDNPSADLAAHGLRPPKFIFSLSTLAEGETSAGENAKTVVAFVGEVKKEEGNVRTYSTFLKVRGPRVFFQVSLSRLSDFMGSIDHFRDQTPFKDAGEVSEIIVRRYWPDSRLRDSFRFKKTADKFELFTDKDVKTPVDQQKLNVWLEELIGFKVLTYLAENEAVDTKGNPPVVEYEIEVPGVASLELATSVIGVDISRGVLKDTPRYAFIKSTEDRVPAVVSAVAYRELIKGPAHFEVK